MDEKVYLTESELGGVAGIASKMQLIHRCLVSAEGFKGHVTELGNVQHPPPLIYEQIGLHVKNVMSSYTLKRAAKTFL